MIRAVPWLTALTLVSGCATTDPTIDSLDGRWRGTVAGLGIGFVTLDLTEDNHTITGTGEWTAQTGSATGTLTAQGLRFDAEIQLSLVVAPPAAQTLILVGRVLSPSTFYLLFPTDPNARRVTFERR